VVRAAPKPAWTPPAPLPAPPEPAAPLALPPVPDVSQESVSADDAGAPLPGCVDDRGVDDGSAAAPSAIDAPAA
jgi:hypothetical protein